MLHKQSTTAVVAAVAAACLSFTLGVAFAPRPPTLSQETAGDAALVERVRGLLGSSPGSFDRMSVAVLQGDDVRQAHFGAFGDTVYEIGSVTKTMTASLLQVAVERGEVTLDTRLGELLDLSGAPAGELTLEELATHHSGLPRVSPALARIGPRLVALVRVGDPYGASLAELVADARDVKLGEQTFAYSNFGYALLGQALASAADTDWPTLVRERLHEPLSMRDTTAATTAAELPADAPTGYTAAGRPSSPWTLGADAPAGNVRSTLQDMITYMSGQLDRSVPGAEAAEPRRAAGSDGERVGLAWFTTSDGLTWHNGGTGGFASFVAFDRDRSRSVIVLSNTANYDAVDALGIALMSAE